MRSNESSSTVTIVPAAPPSDSAAPADSAAPDARNTEFRAVEGGTEMQSGTALLTEAYAAIWLCAFALIVAGLRKMRRLEARIEGLADELARAREPKKEG
jgi:hypothetical protein